MARSHLRNMTCCFLGGLLLSSCGFTIETPGNPVLINRLPEAAMDFTVDRTGNSHTYTVQGTANFPDQTELNILALRQLAPTDQTLEPKLTYSVLDYQVVQVQDEQWQGELTLRQLAADGSRKETWQLDQADLAMDIKPLDTVVFIATYTPLDQLTTLERILAQQGLKVSPDLLQTTLDGRRYLEIKQVLDIPAASEVSERPKPYNGGWGTRHILIQEPPMPYQVEFPEERQTNRPADPKEFLY
ncbi:MAG: hypothetical protein AAGI45_09685 [Cyanobacteria bacterium P01_H01_bin.26]